MNKDNAIEVRNVKKIFRVYNDKGHQLKEKVLFHNRNKYEEKRILDGISFDVKKGEVVGLIGHNGCGKSTTLKLLTRIMYPDEGTIEVQGRVSSLIELGAGFHPDMSGRENIYINASIFGLTRKEIDERVDDIISFSELEEYIDNPVRTYSSGMYARLAFSVAINVNADILLVDEILSVGDVNFQKKCFDKMFEMKKEGKTIVVVSHSQAQIEQICNRVIWLHSGLIVGEGIPNQVYREYLSFMQEKRLENSKRYSEKNAKNLQIINGHTVDSSKHNSEGKVFIYSYELLDKNGDTKFCFLSGEKMIIRVNYTCVEKQSVCDFGLSIHRNDGLLCYASNTITDKFSGKEITEDGFVEYIIDDIPLLQGNYYFDVTISNGNQVLDFAGELGKFEIQQNNHEEGIMRIRHEWR